MIAAQPGRTTPVAGALLKRIDARVGDAVEGLLRHHHDRRLRRLGHHEALDRDAVAAFAAGDPPPRPGCRLQVLVDGAEALPAMVDALRAARSHVHITGWHLDPAFEMVKGDEPVVVGRLLAELAERVDVRVMVWAGAPVPLFHPTRKEVEADVRRLVRDTRIQAQRDPREHPVHCHHEKTILVDDEVAFVGGVDLTGFAGDRFDTSGHPARRQLGWHDVATRLEGPAVADVAAHFRMRWHEVTGELLPKPAMPAPLQGPGTSTVQVVRTVAEDMYDALPHGDFRILEAYLKALRGARRLVYLENQFLWSPEVVAVLADKLRRPPDPAFRLVVLLPGRANNGQEDTKGQVALLADADADGGGGRFLAATVRSLSEGRADPLYVHAKVGVVDDRWLTVGSANLNSHSLLNDTEMNVVTDDAELARATRERLWAEHLGLPLGEVRGADPVELVDRRWLPIAREQLERRESGRPPTHRLIGLPGVSRRSMRLLGPLQELVDDT
ncbi:MAG: phosphatidylserine/phosphatidylglycerophosphate/cardiolipin synthase family protein [Solirubrobacterales bacterium]|nr:phosphatidylserine/phosphatidylglycerophosphate/cardiolipin synthase family protein [Solirubrobacterales bacterium]